MRRKVQFAFLNSLGSKEVDIVYQRRLFIFNHSLVGLDVLFNTDYFKRLSNSVTMMVFSRLRGCSAGLVKLYGVLQLCMHRASSLLIVVP